MFAIDIETIPNEALIPTLPEPEVSFGNTKDPEKIKAKIEEAKREQIEKMALNPFYGRICSYAVFGDIQKYHVIDSISDASEIELITEILNLFCMTQTSWPDIITWNGHTFDIPFIYKRALLLKIDLPVNCLRLSQICKKYTIHPHCDIMQEICGWQGHLKLDHAAASILGDRKIIDIDVTKFISVIKEGKQEEIGIYNLKDAELTYNIYKRVAPYYF